MGAKRRKPVGAAIRGLSKGSTFQFALELEIYGKVGTFGSRKAIIEQSLAEYFERNPLPRRLREAALVIIEEGA